MQRKIEHLNILENVHETLTEVLKQVANEPSVGLYFVQQHVHKAVPALLTLKSQLVESIVDAELATADAKDALGSLRTMKECGPPVIEHMIKTLQSASNTIPAFRQSRRSISQLLPRPVRPPGVSRGPLRSSSFLSDWQSDTSKKKGSVSSGSLQKDPTVGTLNMQEMPPSDDRSLTIQEPAEQATAIFPDVRRTRDLPTERVLNPGQQDIPNTASHDGWDKVTDAYLKSVLGTAMPRLLGNTGTDSMDSIQDIRHTDGAMNEKLLVENMEETLVGNPSHYIDTVYDSALLQTESVSNEGATYVRRDDKMVENDNRTPRQFFLGSGKKMPTVLPEKVEQELQPMQSGSSSDDPIKVQENFEQFQAERAAKLEAWLSEPDGDYLSKFEQT